MNLSLDKQRRPTQGLARLLILVSLAIFSIISVPTSVGAQGPGPSAATGPSMTMAGQTFVTGPGQIFELQLNLKEVSQPDRYKMVVTLHEPVKTRSRFSQTIDGSRGQALRTIERPVSLSTPNGGTTSLFFTLANPGEVEDLDKFPLLGPGVYPVHVSLQLKDSSQQYSSLTTYLIRSPDPDSSPPLRVALIHSFGSSPSLSPAGSIDLSRSNRSNLEGTAEVLSKSNLALTLAPIPETLDALANLQSNAATALAGSLANRQVIARPYVNINLPLLSSSQPEAIDQLLIQRTQGLASLDEHLNVRPVERTWMSSGPLDEPSLDNLLDLGIDRVVLPETSMVPLSLRLSLTRPFLLRDSRGQEVSAVSIDKALGDHLTNNTDQVLGAFHLMADLAVLYFDSPSTQRGVALTLPSGTKDAVSPEALKVLLDALSNSQALVRPVTVDFLFDEVDYEATAAGKKPLVRRFVRQKSPTSGALGPDEIKLQRDLDSVRTLVRPEDGTIDLGERLFLISNSAEISAEERKQYLSVAKKQITKVTGRIRLVDRGTYRLTDQEGTVPITLTNTNPNSPAKVMLRLKSEKLEFLDGDKNQPGTFSQVILLNKANNTLRVPVRYRTSGAFPMEVEVLTPDGNLLLIKERFVIRSTSISGVGILLSLGAFAFLMLWWGRHWRSSRRAKRLIARPGVKDLA